MGRVDVVAVVLEEPATPSNEDREVFGLRHRFFLLGNHPLEVAEKIPVQAAKE